MAGGTHKVSSSLHKSESSVDSGQFGSACVHAGLCANGVGVFQEVFLRASITQLRVDAGANQVVATRTVREDSQFLRSSWCTRLG